MADAETANNSIRIAEELLIFATLIGPILAVQAQKFIERTTEKRRHKLNILYTLMATRASRLSREHVQALNMIGVAFYGTSLFGFHWQTKKERNVCTAWRSYFDYLCNSPSTPENATSVLENRDNYFIELLYSIVACMGYTFDKVYLKRNMYSPVAHNEAEETQLTISKSLAKILSGHQSIPMAVTHFPVSEEALKMQEKVQYALLASLKW